MANPPLIFPPGNTQANATLELGNLIAIMKKAAELRQLMSLTAEQAANEQLPICVVYDGPERNGRRRFDKYLPLIQPVWRPVADAEQREMTERCVFSAADSETRVLRWTAVDVTYRRGLGDEIVKRALADRPAQACQHAIEHLGADLADDKTQSRRAPIRPRQAEVSLSNNRGFESADFGLAKALRSGMLNLAKELSDPALPAEVLSPFLSFDNSDRLAASEQWQINIIVYPLSRPRDGLLIADRVVNNCRPIIEDFLRRIGVEKAFNLTCLIHDFGAGWMTEGLRGYFGLA